MARHDPMDPTPTEQIRVRLSHRDRELILSETFLGGDLETRLRVAVADGKEIVVDLTLDDLDELLGYVAAEANHSEESTLRRQLYRLYDRLSAVEESTAVPTRHRLAGLPRI